MKIISVHVQSFGKLKDVDLALHDGINVIQNINGFGKTTMASFIRAMLYGFTYKTVGGLKDNARFAPWQGTGKFGGSMVVEHEGQTFRIERFFGGTAKQETLTVVNEKTGKALELNEMQCGEYFLGLTADSYDRSAYFPQEAVALASNDNLDSRLANLIENGADDYDKIQEKLRSYKKSLRYEKGNGGKIYELEQRRSRLLQQQCEAERAQRRALEIDSQLREIEAEKQALLNQPKPQPPQPTEAPQTTQRNNKILLHVGLVFAAIGAIFLALGIADVLHAVGFIVGAQGLLLGIAAIAVYLWQGALAKRKATQQSQPEIAQDGYETDTVEQLNALSVQFGRLTEERKGLVFDRVALQDELLNVAAESKQAQFDYEVADTVSQLLAEAKDNLSSSYLPKLTKRCAELLSDITQSAYEVEIDRTFNVKIREKGQTREMNAYSRGIREITLLCFRVALSELLYDGAVPFIIIDDAFVNFDEQNFLHATQLLKQLARHAQVVYFTCHDRLGELK